MVEGNLAHKVQPETKQDPLAPTLLKYTSVSLSEVQSNHLRLEASTFNLDAKAAQYRVEHNPFGYVHLWGQDGLVKEAFVCGRFKRIYTDKTTGVPFYQPSSITDIYPYPDKYISENTDVDLNSLRVHKGMLLMTVSGSIGRCSIVGRSLDNKIFSHDLLRLTGKNDCDTGYIYAFFNTVYGQQQLQGNLYGAVIQHIEPEHLKNIIIPNAPDMLKRQIHNLIVESYDLRDQSNDLIDEAERLLYEELHLPPIEQLKPDYFDKNVELRNYITKMSDLNLRLDCSYHTPDTKAIKKLLVKNAKVVKKIGDKDISKNIILAGRFKRTYVDDKNGIPFFGGKQLLELNPSNIKYLSRAQHEDRIGKELFLKENMIAVTCSGTIGKVNIIPKHWENWAMSQHVMRIVPASNDIAGYIYCWLNTDYAYRLIVRNTYGAVVDEIDDTHLSQVAIPILKDAVKQREINEKVLQANALRYQAYLKEKEAVNTVENLLKSN
ncbi:MAG: restriction endonuclease subunit S [Bacteroidales bacterium]|nr:restriction endonuclease subunit S [Bacteroidales bacterium]